MAQWFLIIDSLGNRLICAAQDGATEPTGLDLTGSTVVPLAREPTEFEDVDDLGNITLNNVRKAEIEEDAQIKRLRPRQLKRMIVNLAKEEALPLIRKRAALDNLALMKAIGAITQAQHDQGVNIVNAQFRDT